MFNWKRCASFSLICTRKRRHSHSVSKPSPSLFSVRPSPQLFLSSSLVSQKLPLFFLGSRLSSLSFSVSDLSTLPVRSDYFLFLSAWWWFDTLLFLEALVYESMRACRLNWFFCVTLTWVNTAMNSANQLPAMSFKSKTRLKTPASVPLLGVMRKAALFYYLSNSVSCPPKENKLIFTVLFLFFKLNKSFSCNMTLPGKQSLLTILRSLNLRASMYQKEKKR